MMTPSWVAMVIREWRRIDSRKENLVPPGNPMFQEEVTRFSFQQNQVCQGFSATQGLRRGSLGWMTCYLSSLYAVAIVKIEGIPASGTDSQACIFYSQSYVKGQIFYLTTSLSACKQFLPSEPILMTHIHLHLPICTKDRVALLSTWRLRTTWDEWLNQAGCEYRTVANFSAVHAA